MIHSLYFLRIPCGLGHRLNRREMGCVKRFNRRKTLRGGKGSGRGGARGITLGLAAALGLSALLVCALSLAVDKEKLALKAAQSFAPVLPLPGVVLGCRLSERLSGGRCGPASAITAGSVAALWLIAAFARHGRGGSLWIPLAVCAGGWVLALLISAIGGRRAGMRKFRL